MNVYGCKNEAFVFQLVWFLLSYVILILFGTVLVAYSKRKMGEVG